MKIRKAITITLLTIFTATTFTNCNKYAEGPSISLKTKKSRASAEWNVETFTYDGEDELNYKYESTFPCSGNTISYDEYYNITRLVWTIKKDGSWTLDGNFSDKTLDLQTSHDLCSASYNYSTSTTLDKGKWQFVNNKKQIEFVFETDEFASQGDVWVLDVLKLKEKNMKLEGIVDGYLLEMNLEKR